MPASDIHIPPDRIEALLDERARRLAVRARRTKEAPRRHLLVCRIGREYHALDISWCGAVVEFSGAIAISGGHPALLGLVSRYGQTAGVVDMARLLNIAPAEDAGRGHLVYLRRDRQFALKVDRVEGAFHLPLATGNQRPQSEGDHDAVHALSAPGQLRDQETVIAVLDLALLLKPLKPASEA